MFWQFLLGLFMSAAGAHFARLGFDSSSLSGLRVGMMLMVSGGVFVGGAVQRMLHATFGGSKKKGSVSDRE